MKRLCLMVVLGLCFLNLSCEKKEETPVSQSVTSAMAPHPVSQPVQHTGVIKEVLQATEYTYLNVEEDGNLYWIAIRKSDHQVGDTISFRGGLEMRNFASKDLNRTFETVLFVDQLVGDEVPSSMPSMPKMSQMSASPHGASMSSGKPVLAKEAISVDPVEGGITIGELFGQRANYASQIVTVKGKVTKVNRNIMGRNWVHLQDGTESQGEFDLTLTTEDDVQVGDIAVFAGVISLDRDFGAGYKYDVIMENAQRVE